MAGLFATAFGLPHPTCIRHYRLLLLLGRFFGVILGTGTFANWVILSLPCARCIV